MAVEALVFPRDNTHPDPVEDARGCYKRGDLVAVRQSPATWGDVERSDFWIVTVTDRDTADVEQFLAKRGESARPRYWIDAAKLSNANRNTLLTTGRLTVPMSALMPAVSDKGA